MSQFYVSRTTVVACSEANWVDLIETFLPLCRRCVSAHIGDLQQLYNLGAIDSRIRACAFRFVCAVAGR